VPVSVGREEMPEEEPNDELERLEEEPERLKEELELLEEREKLLLEWLELEPRLLEKLPPPRLPLLWLLLLPLLLRPPPPPPRWAYTGVKATRAAPRRTTLIKRDIFMMLSFLLILIREALCQGIACVEPFFHVAKVRPFSLEKSHYFTYFSFQDLILGVLY